MDQNKIITALLIITILIVVIVTVSRAILLKMYPGWGHGLPSPGNATPTASNFWLSVKNWGWPKKIPWGWIILIILCLPIIWPIVTYVGLAWVAGMDYQVRGTHPSQYGIVAPKKATNTPLRPKSRTENQDRYKFFVEGPRKHGWKIIPAKVDVEVPLDGQPRYLGINLAFLGGSRIKYTCPGYWSGGEVKLFSQASESTPHHLAHEETIPLYNTGSVTGGDAILIWGEKNLGYRGVSNRVIAEVYPLPNHVRIATTKRVLTHNPQNPQERYAYDWGTVQVGNGTDSPLWQVYIRYANMNGITLSDDLVQQKPGQVMIGVMEGNVFRDVLKEETVVSKPANLYGTYSVPSYEEDLFLRIQPPNVPEGEIMIEIVYDIDYAAR